MAAAGFPAHHHAMKSTSLFPIAKPAAARQPFPATNSRPVRTDVGTSRDEVARKAYFIYLSQGCPQGEAMQHWFEAEAQVIAARNLSRPNISVKM